MTPRKPSAPTIRAIEPAAALRGLRRELGWLLAAKLAALLILWALFFSADQRPGADAVTTGQQLALGGSR